jgi:starch phosphorylase
MTLMALSLSGYVNGVAKRHAEVTRSMFARYSIDAITNGVHAATWVSLPFAELFDRHIPDWRQDSFSLRYALSIPREQVRDAHAQAKRSLIDYVRGCGVAMDEGALTIGFARRATAYKRADLLFHDPVRLGAITNSLGGLQLIFAGKAHPNDVEGKHIIQRICGSKNYLGPHIRVAYLEDYDVRLAKLMTAGVDVWLNTPLPPMEASGTSGMKAALNGVPSLSVLDGWWIEGCIEGVTGWAIGTDHTRVAGEPEPDHSGDAALLYEKLEQSVLPTYYRDPARFLDMRVHCIALNGSFFNTHRMLQQYVTKAYLG